MIDYLNKSVAVIGLRSSGAAAYSFLRLRGAKVSVYDDNTDVTIDGCENLAVRLDTDWVKGLDLIVLSPAIPHNHRVLLRAKAENIPVISELCLGIAELDCPIIAVTGTNGKTTTVGMISKLLKSAGFRVKAVGNIGYPVTQLTLDGEKLDYVVVEASSFQLEYGDIKPYVSAILNLSPDHRDRYDSYQDYVDAKKRLVLFQTSDDFCLLNADDAAVAAVSQITKATVVPFTVKRQDGVCFIKDNYFHYAGEAIASVRDMRIKGEHNKSNMLCALTVGALLKVPAAVAAAFIKKYKLPPHRIEYVATVDGKRFYNDSKGTNVLATTAAVDMVDDKIGLIMGGSDKREDYCEFFEQLPDKVVRVAVTGGNAEKILSSALKVGYPYIEMFDGLSDAVDALAEDKTIKNVLFSPASASFDRFKNYEERGNVFKELVFKIKA